MTLLYKIVIISLPSILKIQFQHLISPNMLFKTMMLSGQWGQELKKFQSSFYPDCISEWNTLGPEVRNAPSVAAFKHKLLLKLRPPVRSIFGIHYKTDMAEML